MHSMIFNRPLNEKMIRVPPCGSLRRLHRVCSHANHKPAYGEKKGSKGFRDKCIAAISWADELSFSTYPLAPTSMLFTK